MNERIEKIVSEQMQAEAIIETYDLHEKVDRAIQYLKSFEPQTEPYYLCYSGGKDSDCIRLLADMAGVNYEIHNNHTTVDAPETVYYIRQVMSQYGELHDERDEKDGHLIHRYGERGFIHIPIKSMFDLISDRYMPPTRLVRYCCSELKEKGGVGRKKITGVRWDESYMRKINHGFVVIQTNKHKSQKLSKEYENEFDTNKYGGIVLNTDNALSRRVVESCYRTTSTLINPIVDWTENDVWNFLKENNCESNPLYKKGFKRIGCVGCPLAGGKHMKMDFNMYPKLRNLYVNAFDKMLKNLQEKGTRRNESWKDGEHVLRWWVGDDENQITLEDYFGDSSEIDNDYVTADSAMP